jgi:hypothetical protein
VPFRRRVTQDACYAPPKWAAAQVNENKIYSESESETILTCFKAS